MPVHPVSYLYNGMEILRAGRIDCWGHCSGKILVIPLRMASIGFTFGSEQNLSGAAVITSLLAIRVVFSRIPWLFGIDD